METRSRRSVARAVGATAVLVLGLLAGVGSSQADAATSPFCGTHDFTRYHYTSTSPHVDHWAFVTHYSALPKEHIHVWDGYPEHGIHKTGVNECRAE